MIKLENLSKYYKSDSNITLGLSKINLELHNKEFVVITGESGSGKSTLLNVISGIDTYEDGELYFNGEETSYYDKTDWENYRRENIAFIFQNYGLIDSYTVLENVLSAMVINGAKAKDSINRAKEIIEKVGLTSHIKHKGTKLSGGQKQRLAIARALAKDSNVLVADEPTGNLDSKTGREIIELLKEISNEKLVVMVTHDFEEVKDLATRKIRVYDGLIAEDTIIKKTVENEYVKKTETRKNVLNTTLFFSKLNIKSQPKRTFFTFMVTIFMSILIGLLLTGVVEFSKMEIAGISNVYFKNLDESRVVIKKEDDSSFTSSEILSLENLNIKGNVFNYDILLDETLTIEPTNNTFFPTNSFLPNPIEILNSNQILKGRMPESNDEVVILLDSYYYDYIDFDEAIDCVFPIDRYNNNYYFKDITIVGIGLLDDSYSMRSQVYLHQDLLSELYFINNHKLDVKLDNSSSIGEIQSINLSFMTKPLTYTEQLNTIYLSEELNAYVDITTHVSFSLDDMVFNDVNIVYTSEFSSEGSYYLSSDLLHRLSNIYQVSFFLENVDDLSLLQNKLEELEYEFLHVYSSSIEPVDFFMKITIGFMIGFFVIVIFIIYLLGYIVLRMIFSEKRKDFGILKSLGLDKQAIFNVNLFELITYFTVSFVFAILIIEIIDMNFSLMDSFVVYDYLYLLVINLVLAFFVARRFSKFINTKSVMQTIKEK
ncbi:MAG: ABC transporter ATP-binding protein [bacterium]